MNQAERALSKQTAHQYGVATRAQILSAGVAERTLANRLRSRDWIRLLPAVYRVHPGPVWQQLLISAQLWGDGRGVISHTSAALIWGFGDFSKDFVDMTFPRHRDDKGHVRVHKSGLDEADVVGRGKFRLTSPIRTLIDLGGVVDEAPLEQALEDALRMRLVSVPALVTRLELMRIRGRNGVGALAGILEARGSVGPVESPLETRFARFVRDRRLPEPTRQLQLAMPGGGRMRLDFAWPEYKVAVEVDGHKHHSDREVFQRDREKSNALILLGWRLLRITHYDLDRRPRQTAEMLRRILGYEHRQGSMRV